MTNQSRNDVSDSLNIRLGIAAVERGYLNLLELAKALFAAQNSVNAHELWVVGGWLDESEFSELTRRIAMDTGDKEISSKLTTAKAKISDAHPDAIPETDESTFSLADVVKTINFQQQIKQNPPDDKKIGTFLSTSNLSQNENSSRYILGGELGRGGVGRVLKAFDRDLGRTVAMKLPLIVPQTQENLEKFIEEAQATGQLEHPNIIPIYDIGILSSGEVYYTMKRIPHHTLRDVLNGLIEKEPEIVQKYTLTRLLSIFIQICQAVQYAHVRGVIHRDLKPENVMIGSYGEVHVLDWGLARVMDRHVVTNRSLKGKGKDKCESGQTVGSPAYMPPEQARGYLNIVDERSDIYSLGVILYEIATLKQPSTKPTVMETLMAVISEDVIPPSMNSKNRYVSDDLEDIILKAISKDREQRFSSVKEFHETIEKHLEGQNEKEAERRVSRGEHFVALYLQAKNDLEDIDKKVLEIDGRINAWDPLAIKRSLWDLQDQRRDTANRMIRMFGEAMREFQQALAYVPGHEWATSGIADLMWSRYQLAEQEGNHLDQLYYESVLSQYDDGTYLAQLYGKTRITIHSLPVGANVFLYEYEEVDRILVLGKKRYLGETPIKPTTLSRGSYQLHINYADAPSINLPIYISRTDPIHLQIQIPPKEVYKEDFLYISPGDSIVGGDPHAFAPLPLQRIFIKGFFMQRYPVTFRQYIEFLNDLHKTDPEVTKTRIPRTRQADGDLVIQALDGTFSPHPVLIEGEMRKLYPENMGFEWDIPVVAIKYADMIHYAQWRSKKDGVTYRLPDDYEWERAARGADGRAFPWGNHFDSTFCKMTSSRPLHNQPEPVGAFEKDCSPFQIRDLAGSIREIIESDEDEVIYRSGSWGDDARLCRSASRGHMLHAQQTAVAGFRLVYDVPDLMDLLYENSIDDTGEFKRSSQILEDKYTDESFSDDSNDTDDTIM